jgi:serine/threonine protein kinase
MQPVFSQPQQHPIFNQQFEIIKSLGEGNTSKVYLGRSLINPQFLVAIKILRDEFLKRDDQTILSV